MGKELKCVRNPEKNGRVDSYVSFSFTAPIMRNSCVEFLAQSKTVDDLS